MDLKDIVEFVMEHAVESLIVILFLAVLCGLFFGGGMKELISVFGTGLFG